MAEAFLRSVEGFTQSLGKERRTRRSAAQIQSIGYSIDFPGGTPIANVIAVMNSLRERLKAEPYLDPPHSMDAYQLDPLSLEVIRFVGTFGSASSFLGGAQSTITAGTRFGSPDLFIGATMTKVRCTFGRAYFLDVGIPTYYLEGGISRPVCIYDILARAYPDGTIVSNTCFDPATGDYINPPPGAIAGRFIISTGQVEYISPAFDPVWALPAPSDQLYNGAAYRNWYTLTTPLDVLPEFAFPVLHIDVLPTPPQPPACCDLSPI